MFRRALLTALIVSSATLAYAQQPEQAEPTTVEGSAAGSAMPEHGFAPPSDEVPPSENTEDKRTGIDEHTGVGHEPKAPHEQVHGEIHDPSKHFNYFDFGWRGKDEMGGKLGDGAMVDPHTGQVVIDAHTGMPAKEEPMSAPFIFMVINFLILFGLLAWKAGPIARKTAEDRHDEIKNALDEAAKLREQAKTKLDELQAKLSSADAEIKAMVDGIRKDAEADKQRILDNAEKLSAQMKRDADTRIAAEIEAARAALTREVTDAATRAAEKLVQEKLQPTDQSKLVASFITDMGSTGGANARR